MQADGPSGSLVLVKNEPSSPTGMDLDIMPEVHDRCGVCQQQCPPSQDKALATCLRCSRRVHATCDKRAADALKASNFLAIKHDPDGGEGQQQAQQLVVHQQHQGPAAAAAGYLCPRCCQQAGEDCPLDLLQLHAALLADMKPRRPRSAADIHAAEVMQKHLAGGGQLDVALLHGLVGHAWKQEQHKDHYMELADEEDTSYQAALAQYESLYQQYANLASRIGATPDIALSLDPQQQLIEARTALAAATVTVVPTARGSGDGAGPSRGGRGRAGLGGDVTYLLGNGGVVTARDGSEVPQLIHVVCNGTRGVFNLSDMKISCLCASCEAGPAGKRIFTPTQFEQHGGCGTAKKWRISLRIEPGGVPEVPRGANPMTFGRWMEMKGIEAKGQRTPAPTTGQLGAISPAEAAKSLAVLAAGLIKSEGDERRGASPTPSGGRSMLEGGDTKPGVAGVPRNRRPESWAPWEDINLGNYKPVQVRWAGDRCCVCDSDVDYDCDQLVSCEACGVTVHQSCYGVPELPDEDDMWLCRSCELKEPGAAEPQCCLCPLTGGGLKPTTLPGMWAHAACMQWIPEVTCIEPLRMEPIDRIHCIQKERWELLCCICRQRMGAKIQCHDCYQAYHPLCARRAGLHMEMAEPAVPNGPLQIITYCPRHCKSQPGSSGISLVNSDEEMVRIGRPRKAGSGSIQADDLNNLSGLWNAQPFKANKPTAPIPAAPGGCARAAPLTDVQRITHGTGTGATTVAGFWIPTVDTAAAAAAAAAGSRGWGGGPASSSTGAGGLGDYDEEFAGGRGGGGANCSRKRKAGRGSRSKPGSKAAVPDGTPPPVVELLPLPEGVPDRIMVACNSRRGVFLVRSQKIEDGMRGGTELTPSRFEALAGKGEAKKWRSSLWAVGPDGKPQVHMGEWLSQQKLDKQLLARLLSNHAAYTLRQQWEEEQAAAAEAAAADGDATDAAVTEGGTEAGGTEAADDGEEEVQQQFKRQKLGQDDAGPADSTAAAAGVEEEEGAAGSPAAMQVDGAAADGEAAAAAVAEPAAKKQRLEAGEAPAAGSSPGGERGSAAPAEANGDAVAPEAAAAAAAAPEAAAGGDGAGSASGSARSTPAMLLKRVHMLQLPLGFRVHPASLPPRAAAAAATRQKQLQQQDQQRQQEQLQQQQQEQQAEAGQAGATAAAPASTAAGASAAGPSALLLAPKHADAAISAVRNPWLCVGQCCRVFWTDDDEWYDADVTGFDPATRKHCLWYHADEVRETIDLRAEEQQGRVQWLPPVDKSQWPQPPVRYQSAQPRPQQQQQSGALVELQQQQLLQQQQQQAAVEPMPDGFPRLTAMHRDPSASGGDKEKADLVGLSSRGAPLAQQLHAMLQLQQHNHKLFSTQQPSRDNIPRGPAAVGWRVGLFRPDVGVYYYGIISSYDAGLESHVVQFDDGVVETVALQQQRIDWVSQQGAAISSAAQALNMAYLQSRGVVPHPPAGAGDAQQQQQQQQALGQQEPAAQQAATSSAAAAAAVAAPAAEPERLEWTGPRPDAPKHVDVMCGSNAAVFDCVKMAVRLSSGHYISPTEFERQSGKGCSKKWKATIRVRKANGLPGTTMGDWLLAMGYEQPKPAAQASTEARTRDKSLDEIRRRQFSRRAAALGAQPPVLNREGSGGPLPGNRGTINHRHGCMCVICKQARRKAALARGDTPEQVAAAVNEPPPGPAAPAAAAAAEEGKAGGTAAAAAAAAGGKGFTVPPWLVGKRAFVRAVPHLVRGPLQHEQWEVPASTCYTPEEWEAQQLAAEDPAAAAAAAGGSSSRPATPGPDSRASTPTLQDTSAAAAAAATATGGEQEAAATAAAAGAGALAAGGADDAGGGDVTMTDAAAPGEQQQQQQGQQQQLAVRGGRSTTWRSKLRVCQELEPKRITFGKSGIHGWGIFARQHIQADTMLTEFRGQLIRGILADVREAAYRKQHRDCYMFHATSETVIDNTCCGNYSRFTNHCCSPCLYVKVLELQGELHLCFFAKTDIRPGQELTFDYRFKEEGGDSKVLCQCAAPNCKGTLN